MKDKIGTGDGSRKGFVIAVDGPAASGKGTIARALAKHFGLPHMDTGLLYRAVALQLWRWGGDPNIEFEALRACDDLGFNADDEELRSEPVSRIASKVSSYASVRDALLQRQRDFAAQEGGAVLDGRDIGTDIAPDAGLARMARVAEGTDIPLAKIRTSEAVNDVHKYGRGIQITYEAARRVRACRM